MKTSLRQCLSLVATLCLGTVSLSAQSCAQASAAVAASAAGSIKIAASAVAVPLWMSGQVVAGSGAVVKAVGESASQAGQSAARGAEEVWDFATGDPEKRPALDRGLGVPPAKAAPAPAPVKDPPPAAALPAKL